MTEKRIFKMTKKLMVGSVPVGGSAPVTIQSMCNTKTDQVDATVAQIHALEAAGCEIISGYGGGPYQGANHDSADCGHPL